MSTTVGRRLHFGSSECSLLYRDCIPLDEAVPCTSLILRNTSPLRPRKKLTDEQLQVLQSALEVDECGDRQRQQALASSLGISKILVQNWFTKNRAKRRREIHRQKMMYTPHHLRRWKTRMNLRQVFKGSPVSTDHTLTYHPLDLQVQQMPPQQLLSDYVTPNCVLVGCLFTPKGVCTAPMPQDEIDCDLLTPGAQFKPVIEHTQVFHDKSVKTSFGELVDSLFKDERIE